MVIRKTYLRHKMGYGSRKLGRLTLALYDRVRAIEPGYARKLFNRGNALANAKGFGEALAYYERSLTIRPDDVDALYNSSVMLRRLRRSDEALAPIDRALALKPDFAEALISRGRILRMQLDVNNAIKCFREAMKLRPADSALHSALIFTLNFDPSASEDDKQFERAEWDRR